jgi:hypothetical protein
MNRKLIIILLVLFCNSAKAQIFTAYAGYNFGTFKNKSFNTFADSYNAYFAGQQTKELSKFSTGSGYNFGFGLFITKNFGFSMNILRYTGHASSELETGKRHFKNRIKSAMFGFPVRFSRLTIHPKLGIANSDILAYFEYKDGTISRGGDKLINGMYMAFGFSGEIAVEINILKLKYLSLDICGAVGGVTGSGEGTEWSWGRKFTVLTAMYADGLPLDFAAWSESANNMSFDYNGKYVENNAKYINAFINLRFALGQHEE